MNEKQNELTPCPLEQLVIPPAVQRYILELRERHVNGDVFYLHGDDSKQCRMAKWLVYFGIIERVTLPQPSYCSYKRRSKFTLKV